MTKTITLQQLFSFPLRDFDSYADLKWEEIPASGQVCRSYRYHAPQGTFLDIAGYFTEVEVKFFESGAYNLLFTGDAQNAHKLEKTTLVFWNALYAIFGADKQGNTEMSVDDYTRLDLCGEVEFTKAWGNYLAMAYFVEDKFTFSLRSQLIEPHIGTEVELSTLYWVPTNDHPIPDTIDHKPNAVDHIPDTIDHKPDTQSAGCLSMIAVFVFLGSLLFL